MKIIRTQIIMYGFYSYYLEIDYKDNQDNIKWKRIKFMSVEEAKKERKEILEGKIWN